MSKKLPKKIIPIKNPDKENHEVWVEGRDMLDFPAPYRMVLLGKPNSGKSTIIKNIVVRASPCFDRIIMVHYDIKVPEEGDEGDDDYQQSSEFDDLDVEIMNELPTKKDFDKNQKTLVILEDLSYQDLTKIEKGLLDRLYGYISTHCNVSVMLTSQDWSLVPPCVRRCSNVYFLWKMDDLDSLKTLGRRVGLQKEDLVHIFDNYIDDSHDSLCIDLTAKSPYPKRINGYQRLVSD